MGGGCVSKAKGQPEWIIFLVFHLNEFFSNNLMAFSAFPTEAKHHK